MDSPQHGLAPMNTQRRVLQPQGGYLTGSVRNARPAALFHFYGRVCLICPRRDDAATKTNTDMNTTGKRTSRTQNSGSIPNVFMNTSASGNRRNPKTPSGPVQYHTMRYSAAEANNSSAEFPRRAYATAAMASPRMAHIAPATQPIPSARLNAMETPRRGIMNMPRLCSRYSNWMNRLVAQPARLNNFAARFMLSPGVRV